MIPAFSLRSVNGRVTMARPMLGFVVTSMVALRRGSFEDRRMPYQDRHPVEAGYVEPTPAVAATASSPEATANDARTIQIIIVVGLVAAIIVAIFGS